MTSLGPVMKVRLRSLLFSVLVAGCAVGVAQACPEPEPGEYDEATGPNALVILAEVLSIDFSSNEDANCSRAVYEVRETFLGPQFDVVESQACFVREVGDVKVRDLSFESSEELSKSRHESGFYPGALVLVSLTRQVEPGRLLPPIQSQSEYRPALTSCWGYPHVNIGILPQEQRSELISGLRESVTESKVEEENAGKSGTPYSDIVGGQ